VASQWGERQARLPVKASGQHWAAADWACRDHRKVTGASHGYKIKKKKKKRTRDGTQALTTGDSPKKAGWYDTD